MDGYKSWFNAIDMWLHKGISETCNKYQVELNLLKLLSSNRNQWWIIQKDKLPYRSIIDRYLFRHKKQIINPSVPDMIKKVKKAGNWDSLLKLFGLQEFEKEIKALIEKEKTPAFLIGMRCEGDKFVFNKYEKALICLLGDSYEYFYKFHPAVKVEKLTVDDLPVPLKIIPNTAPYELLIPEDRPCIVAGPNSSLFLTTGNTHQHICFGFSRSNADKSNPVFGYVSIIDVFISDPAMDIKNGKYVPKEVKNLVSLKNKCILLEFVHEIEYEIGLYDQIDNKIEFYKWEDGQYRIVKTVHR